MLVGWLIHSTPEVRAAGYPPSLHTLKDSHVRRFAEKGAWGAHAKRPRLGSGASAPVIRSFEPVRALGYHPRPKGAAPANDQGTRVTWSYLRGMWVDTEYPGTWKGVAATCGADEVIASETAELDLRLTALNAGCDAEKIKAASSEGEVRNLISVAEAAAKAEFDATEAQQHDPDAAPSRLELMDRLLPKLEQRLQLRLQDPGGFETKLRSSGAQGHAAAALRADVGTGADLHAP